MTKTQSPLTILPPLTSPFKGEQFYRIKVLNLDISICLGFSALSSGFNLGEKERGAQRPPFSPLLIPSLKGEANGSPSPGGRELEGGGFLHPPRSEDKHQNHQPHHSTKGNNSPQP